MPVSTALRPLADDTSSCRRPSNEWKYNQQADGASNTRTADSLSDYSQQQEQDLSRRSCRHLAAPDKAETRQWQLKDLQGKQEDS